MNVLKYIIIIIMVLLALLSIVYLVLLFKIKNINNKLYRYSEEKILKDKNVLIIYQRSRHKTITKIKDIIKNKVLEKGYGVNIHTLSKDDDTYNNYKYTIFIVPVYFGEVNRELLAKVKNNKIKHLIIIYNGINVKSNNEDDLVKKQSISKYSKLKVHTDDIQIVEEFIDKEVL